MPHKERTARERSRLPATEAAALAALSISETLVLAMVESGSLDPQVLRRCLLDALAAHDNLADAEGSDCERGQAIHAEAVNLIDHLLCQVEAVAPSRPGAKNFRTHSTEQA